MIICFFGGGHLVHVGHISLYFGKKQVHEIKRLPAGRSVSKYMHFLLNLELIFCMVAMLAAILKNKVYKDAHEVEQILWGKLCKLRETYFYQHRFGA